MNGAVGHPDSHNGAVKYPRLQSPPSFSKTGSGVCVGGGGGGPSSTHIYDKEKKYIYILIQAEL